MYCAKRIPSRQHNWGLFKHIQDFLRDEFFVNNNFKNEFFEPRSRHLEVSFLSLVLPPAVFHPEPHRRVVIIGDSGEKHYVGQATFSVFQSVSLGNGKGRVHSKYEFIVVSGKKIPPFTHNLRRKGGTPD